MEELFDELKSNTINMRLLWQDLYVTRDHNVMQTMLATGFNDFGKGPINHLR